MPAFRYGDVAGKVVVGVSTVLTWADTPRGAEDPPLQEGANKRRRAPPAFAGVKALESHVLGLAREGLRSHVVATGIMYGRGESHLHALVKVRPAPAR